MATLGRGHGTHVVLWGGTMAVVFEELEGSPSFRVTAGGRFQGTRRFKVPWDDCGEFVVELVGGYRMDEGAFVYTPPATFPLASHATVLEAQVEPFPPDNPDGSELASLTSGANRYEYALVTAQYGMLFDATNKSRPDLPDVPAGTYLTYSSDLGAEYESIPGRSFVWYDDGEPVPDDMYPGILVPTEELRLSWHRVPSPPWNSIRDLRGKVNDSAFLNHAAGTVLFQGARTSREFQLQDPGMFRLDYHFRVREVQSTAASTTKYGWNFRYREQAIAGEHWLEIADLDLNRPYAAGDFSALFEFGS